MTQQTAVDRQGFVVSGGAGDPGLYRPFDGVFDEDQERGAGGGGLGFDGGWFSWWISG